MPAMPEVVQFARLQSSSIEVSQSPSASAATKSRRHWSNGDASMFSIWGVDSRTLHKVARVGVCRDVADISDLHPSEHLRAAVGRRPVATDDWANARAKENTCHVHSAVGNERVAHRVQPHAAVFWHGLRVIVQLFAHRLHTKIEGASSVAAHEATAHLIGPLKESDLGHRLSSLEYKLFVQPRDEVCATDSAAYDCEVKVELRGRLLSPQALLPRRRHLWIDRWMASLGYEIPSIAEPCTTVVCELCSATPWS
eukprot:scaffold2022_cov63-Phaeocystis_antarctica.AAC.8